MFSINQLAQLEDGKSRSINWENRNGEKGKGGMETSSVVDLVYLIL